MAVTTQSPAPYAPGTAVNTVISRFRNRGLQQPITKEVLIRAGVSESLVPRTLQALQTLDLIDDSGTPTPALLKLRSVPESDYKATMLEWMQSAYAEVFQFADPRHDDAIRVRDAFRAYTPHGQQDRMVSLFMSLCVEAGIIDAPPNDPKPAMRKPSRTAAAPASARAKPQGQRSQSQAPPHAPTAAVGLAPALMGMLESIPKGGKGWTKQDRDKFVLTFNAVLDFAVPVVSAESLREADQPDETGDEEDVP